MAGEFLKELEEDIHHEEWIHFWRRRGPLIAALVVITLLGTGGYLWWFSHQQAQREATSALYEKAVTSLNAKGPTVEAENIFKTLAAQSEKGYGLLSRLQLVRLYSLKLKGTPEVLESLMKEKDEIVRLAQKDRNLGIEGAVSVGFGYLALDSSRIPEVSREAIFEELKQYDMPQNPWKSLSLELQGVYLLKQKNPKAADFYKSLLLMPDMNQSIRLRLSMEAISAGFSFPLRTENDQRMDG